MSLKSLFISAVLAATATASAIEPLFIDECGTPEPSPEHRTIAQEMGRNETMIRAQALASGDSFTEVTTTVPVYVHVVAESESVEGGYLSAEDIKIQVQVINDAYKSSGFQFELQETDWTIDEDWANNSDDLAMKTELRKGDYSTLNLYFQKSIDGTVLGRCHFPTDVEDGSEKFLLDGCNVRAKTAPRGATAPHEVGHWLGLYHTFQGGCVGDNDMVDDTPACQKSHACKKGQDTCPDQPGLDMINNFMAYGNCRDTFTPGQFVRMRSSWDRYRG